MDIKTSHGTIQGYNGVAAVDAKHQVIIAAQAYGQGPEHDLFKPMVKQVFDNLKVTKKTETTDDHHSGQWLPY